MCSVDALDNEKDGGRGQKKREGRVQKYKCLQNMREATVQERVEWIGVKGHRCVGEAEMCPNGITLALQPEMYLYNYIVLRDTHTHTTHMQRRKEWNGIEWSRKGCGEETRCKAMRQ